MEKAGNTGNVLGTDPGRDAINRKLEGISMKRKYLRTAVLKKLTLAEKSGQSAVFIRASELGLKSAGSKKLTEILEKHGLAVKRSC